MPAPPPLANLPPAPHASSASTLGAADAPPRSVNADDESGYASDASNTTVQGSRTRRAFLVREGEGGQAVRLAFGECRPDDGVFVVAEDGVFDDGADVDVGDAKLGGMAGAMIAVNDLDDAELDFEWADDLEWADDELGFAFGWADDAPPGAIELEEEEEAPDRTEQEEPAQLEPEERTAKETAFWRERAQELEDDLQWHRDALLQARADASDELLMACSGADDVRIRVEIDDPEDKRNSKLIPLAELLQECRRRGERPPILTSTERLRKQQNVTSAYKSRSSDRLVTIGSLQSELERVRQQHAAERDSLQRELAYERQRADSIAAWKRIECRRLQAHEAQRLQEQGAKHGKKLEQIAKRAATWTRKRNNMTRMKARAAAARDRERERAKTALAEVQALAANEEALQAELGQSFKVAPQRQAAHANAAFTFNTILRDLKVRQQSLNSGAGNVRAVTHIYSEHVSANGCDLQLESGSLSSVLRWEKRTDVVCMLLEGRRLRQALLEEPRTRLWSYVDLSPDCRAIEQCGMGLEYAKVAYIGPDGDAPVPSAAGRISGAPLTVFDHVWLGVDGCPITVETWTRVFGPMLAAFGPKYASTNDCFMRLLQIYGSTVPELLDPDFCFATVERHDVPVPLIEYMEGLVSDAGGEVQKSGGVIDTVVPTASWRHCGAHGGNLSLEKSHAFRQVGVSVRSLSSFCRNGNKHQMLVLHMKRVQQPELAVGQCDERLLAIYRDAHAAVRTHGQFHEALGGCETALEPLAEQLEHLEQLELQLVADAQLDKKSKKGTDVRWKFECEVLHDRLLDIAHLLAPAILIEYGVGETYATLKIDQEKNKTACTALATLVDPSFIFWATHLRLLYTHVYKDLFSAVQANHHHAAPMLSGPGGLPVQWAAAMREGVVQKGGKAQLSPTVCAPLVELLKKHKSLGGEHAAAAVADLEAQAQHIETYFAKWRSLEGLVHALAREDVVQGPLPRDACECAESDQLGVGYFDLLPRVPAPEALAAAAEGLRLFEAASLEERNELPGTLPWLLFSPAARDGTANPIFEHVKAFAAGEVNAYTDCAYPYRCWPELTKVLVAGGAKYCPSTSAQLESLFTGLTRQQGASKNNISQPQISFEARCRKNDTMEGLTENVLRDNWPDARAVQGMLDAKGFWVCDLGLAADRKLSQKLKEEREVELAQDGDSDAIDGGEEKYEVERIEGHKKDRKTGEYIYIIKWKGYDKGGNTEEPEAHLITCSVLLTYWKGKKKSKPQLEQVARVTKLQEAALRERYEASMKRRTKPLQREPVCEPAAPTGNVGNHTASRPAGVPEDCRTAYDRAHSALSGAHCLVFDTETSGFTGCVLNIGWILADADGGALVSYERLWHLPEGERIDRRALAAHGISAARLARNGVPAKPELAEFLALMAAAEATGVRIVAHHASFDVRVLNHTALCQGLAASLRSATMLCTMHGATRHCGLRQRGGKSLKAPRNEELYIFLFGRKPTAQLHSALPDCRVTLASYIEGRKRKWW